MTATSLPKQEPEKKYYMIKDIDGGACQIIRHGMASAMTELRRLCAKHKGRRFMLFEAYGAMVLDKTGKEKKIKADYCRIPSEKQQYFKLRMDRKKAINKHGVAKGK